MQATRIRPDTRPTDLRRLAAATLSAVIPGLGQLFNRRRRARAALPDPIAHRAAASGCSWSSSSRRPGWPPGSCRPQVLGTLLALNVLALVWRLVAVGQAFLDTRRHRPDRPARASAACSSSPSSWRSRTWSSTATGRSSATRSTRSSRARSWAPRTRGRDGRTRPRRRRADQRPARRHRQARRPGGEPDRHDDGRLARPGRPHASRWCRCRAT